MQLFPQVDTLPPGRRRESLRFKMKVKQTYRIQEALKLPVFTSLLPKTMKVIRNFWGKETHQTAELPARFSGVQFLQDVTHALWDS